MGYFAVLTKQTAEIASGKKDRTGPALARYAGLFPHMLIDFGNGKLRTHTAISVRHGISVRMAVSGAQGAIFIELCCIQQIHIVLKK